MTNQKITPFLWFDGQAEEAITLYTSIFPNSKILNIKHWAEGGPYPKTWVMQGTFEINGLRVHAFDAGPQFKFTEAISMFVDCKDQAEIDYYWDKLIADGGQESMCGWLKDKFGVSWQIIPNDLTSLFNHPNKTKADAAMQALYKMQKINIQALKDAVGV
jgi:predicted 3-demethylubiquinone-9 3-methyltransferase (glyoxalase superfamily)